ncbi:hypothetical protein Tco_0230896 [Tanacetum coccineum]
MIPGKGDLHDYWRDISTGGDFLGPPPSYTLIRDPMLRLCHRMMSHSIADRSQAPKKVTVTDLFYLRGLDVGSVNIPYLLARYLRRLAAGRKSGAHISGGKFVARLAEHFGEVDDTWAWVAMVPEREFMWTYGEINDRPGEILHMDDFVIPKMHQAEDWRGQHLHSPAGPATA